VTRAIAVARIGNFVAIFDTLIAAGAARLAPIKMQETHQIPLSFLLAAAPP
jgi:hypothetical protein